MSSPSDAWIGSRKNESRMMIAQPSRTIACTTPRIAAQDLVHRGRLREQRLVLVEALDDEREHDGRGHEHEPETDHVAVFPGELVPVVGEEAAHGVAQVRRPGGTRTGSRRGRAAGAASPG